MDKPCLQISELGHNGRWGNQIFAIMLGMGLAQKLGVNLEIPSDWIGYNVFNLPSFVRPIKTLAEPTTELDYIPTSDDLANHGSIKLHGYWQNQASLGLYSVRNVREWLDFKPWVLEMFAKKSPTPRIVVHKRRGDYVRQPNHYCSITDASFDKAVEQVKAKYGEASVIEITEESPTRNAYCEAFGLGFLADFMLMVNADYLVRSNSTFSLVAGWFSDVKVFAPVVTDKVGWQDVDFVEGNWPRCADSSRHPVELTDLHLREI